MFSIYLLCKEACSEENAKGVAGKPFGKRSGMWYVSPVNQLSRKAAQSKWRKAVGHLGCSEQKRGQRSRKRVLSFRKGGNLGTDMHAERMPCDRWSHDATSWGSDPSLEPPDSAWPCGHLDFRLLAYRTATQYLYCLSKKQREGGWGENSWLQSPVRKF